VLAGLNPAAVKDMGSSTFDKLIQQERGFVSLHIIALHGLTKDCQFERNMERPINGLRNETIRYRFLKKERDFLDWSRVCKIAESVEAAM
jgi:hypothetical protein